MTETRYEYKERIRKKHIGVTVCFLILGFASIVLNGIGLFQQDVALERSELLWLGGIVLLSFIFLFLTAISYNAQLKELIWEGREYSRRNELYVELLQTLLSQERADDLFREINTKYRKSTSSAGRDAVYAEFLRYQEAIKLLQNEEKIVVRDTLNEYGP